MSVVPIIVIMARRKKLVASFKEANALSVESAVDTRLYNIRQSFLFNKMVDEGVFINTDPYCYYLDEARENELRKQRCKVILILTIVSIIALLIALFVVSRPSFAN